ncbi:MAG: hypothetical protein ISP49_04270 [Reyranella sp.]|nr:hypothetical protein [Reyranella sp.]MBL6650784.1 hypothetical protein [Reyranella sp.]
MKRTSPIAAIAASLLSFGPLSAAAADDTLCDVFPFDSTLASEERLLGDGAEALRFAALQAFTGADLERFRRQVGRALDERKREAALADASN